ncbi:MAG: hypothetical protein IPI49_26475 [Myxococcales bacterium]|nr:hypothetical protein [Myxococcales bacterium]
MIAHPFNDATCLGHIGQVAAEMVATADPVLAEIARQHATTESLAAWIRGLPQRDDNGAAKDGPKVHACAPPQRLRLPAPDPNCVERAALYVAVAELIDPAPVRQLATLDTPIGMHTFPLENGEPVILDPRVHRNGLAYGVALQSPGPVSISPLDAIEWTTQLAELGAETYRNGPSRVSEAREVLRRLVNEGEPPATVRDVDGIAWLLTLSEQVARRYGPRALMVVRSTAQALAELADEALARSKRNASLRIGGYTLRPAPWASALAGVAGRVGVNVGLTALRAKLASMGVPPSLFGAVEKELQAEGYDPRTFAEGSALPLEREGLY